MAYRNNSRKHRNFTLWICQSLRVLIMCLMLCWQSENMKKKLLLTTRILYQQRTWKIHLIWYSVWSANKVFVDFNIYFCNRGRENLRDIKKSDFIFDENDNFIVMRDVVTKNHKGDVADEESQGGRIYKTGKTSCPFLLFQKYLSVLHPDSSVFFQRPKLRINSESTVWYDNSPLGCNTLGTKWKKLSVEAKWSKSYMNHCLRATSITILNEFEARHVMTVSGNKSETSLRHYARTSEHQREKMALTIAEAVTGTICSVQFY